jgi:hypothetical protein
MEPITILQNKIEKNKIEAQAEEFAEIIEERNNSQKCLVEKFNKKNKSLTFALKKRLTFDPNG